jgi:hypothetical protein
VAAGEGLALAADLQGEQPVTGRAAIFAGLWVGFAAVAKWLDWKEHRFLY